MSVHEAGRSHAFWLFYNLSMFSAPNELFKSQLKVFIKTCVEQRVDQRINITKPRQKISHFRGHSVDTQTYNQLLDKKW